MEGIVTGPGQDPPDLEDPRPLDEVFASRSHVRVLRALITKDPSENVGVRDIARQAGVSHPRASQVLTGLTAIGLVLRNNTRWGPVYDLHGDHFLAPQLWTLFDEELHVLQAIEGFVRGEARRTRRAVRARLEIGLGHDLEIVVTGVSQFGWEDRLWFQQLEAELAKRFGLDVQVGPPNPGEWLLTLD